MSHPTGVTPQEVIHAYWRFGPENGRACEDDRAPTMPLAHVREHWLVVTCPKCLARMPQNCQIRPMRDTEIQAIFDTMQSLTPLDGPARRRVIEYVQSWVDSEERKALDAANAREAAR